MQKSSTLREAWTGLWNGLIEDSVLRNTDASVSGVRKCYEVEMLVVEMIVFAPRAYDDADDASSGPDFTSCFENASP